MEGGFLPQGCEVFERRQVAFNSEGPRDSLEHSQSWIYLFVLNLYDNSAYKPSDKSSKIYLLSPVSFFYDVFR